MTGEQFDKVCVETWERCMDIMRKKGPDYAAGGDRLDNFKHSRMGFTPMQVLGDALDKQLSAIYIYMKTGELTGESIELRIADGINYLLLLQGLVDESYSDHKSCDMSPSNREPCNEHETCLCKFMDDHISNPKSDVDEKNEELIRKEADYYEEYFSQKRERQNENPPTHT